MLLCIQDFGPSDWSDLFGCQGWRVILRCCLRQMRFCISIIIFANRDTFTCGFEYRFSSGVMWALKLFGFKKTFLLPGVGGAGNSHLGKLWALLIGGMCGLVTRWWWWW